jgi:uncharacterized protein YpbB
MYNRVISINMSCPTSHTLHLNILLAIYIKDIDLKAPAYIQYNLKKSDLITKTKEAIKKQMEIQVGLSPKY